MTKKLTFAILLILAAAVSMATTTATPRRGAGWYQGFQFVPNSATDVVTATTFLDVGYFANTTGSPVTVTLVDKTTACNSAACQFWPVVSIAANAVTVVNFNGVVVTSGFQWSASSANAVVGQVQGAFTK